MTEVLSKEKIKSYAGIFFLVAILMTAYFFTSSPARSVEVDFTAHSPLGMSGGAIVPASCPSYDHTTAGACAACPSGYAYNSSDVCVRLPSCTVTYTPSLVAPLQSLTVTWSASDATSRTYSLYRSDWSAILVGYSIPVSGSVDIPSFNDLPEGTYTRIDTVTGPTGSSQCVATLTVSYAADVTRPSIISLYRYNVDPVTGTAASYTVNFSETVTGVTSADFPIVQSGGVSGATISSITNTSGGGIVTSSTQVNSVQVLVTNITGSGTLGLNFLYTASGSVADLSGNTANTNFTGPTYTISQDVCANIAGTQTTVPTGYYQTGGNCFAEIATLSANPTTIDNGGSTTLTWSCDHSSSAISNFSSGMAGSGSVSVSPVVTTNYTMQCPTGAASQTTVTVNNPTLTLTPVVTRVKSGQATTISWSATDVISCTVTGPGISSTALTGVNVSTGAITAQSTYRLACQTAQGNRSVTATVNVIPSVIEF